VVAIGSARSTATTYPVPGDQEQIDASPVRALEPEVASAMIAEIEGAQEEKDTLGGIVEVLAYGVPPGLGSHVHHDRRLDGLLAGALMSIQAIKAVEVGSGFAVAGERGSSAHDEIYFRNGAFGRDTDRAGGVEGGMSTGQPVRVRAAMKPLSTLMRPLDTVDVVSKQPDKAFRERSDVCAVPAAGVVAEAMVAIVIAQECQRKFGGDTMADLIGAAAAYRERLSEF